MKLGMAMSKVYIKACHVKHTRAKNLCACNSDSLNTAVLVDMETKVSSSTLSDELVSLQVTVKCFSAVMTFKLILILHSTHLQTSVCKR